VSGVPSDQRIDRLEERLAWLERHIGEQDKAMLKLTEENLRLARELAQVRSAVSSSPLQGGREDGGAGAAEERPPHY
jgi:SlyX protein